MPKISKMYTMEEVGEIVKFHPATLKSWARSGVLPAVKMGVEWRVSEETLQSLMTGGIQLRKVGRPKATPAEDCGYPMSPETAAMHKADAKAKREAKKADAEPSDEEMNRLMQLSDESRLLRQRAERAKKESEGGEDAQS